MRILRSAWYACVFIKSIFLMCTVSDLRTWDGAGCDINAELQAVATEAPVGEEGPNGKSGHSLSRYTYTILVTTPY